MKKSIIKAVISTLLLLTVLLLAATGALLYFGKTGLVWGISRYFLREFHFYMAIFMCVLAVVHMVLNFRQYFSALCAIMRRRRD